MKPTITLMRGSALSHAVATGIAGHTAAGMPRTMFSLAHVSAIARRNNLIGVPCRGRKWCHTSYGPFSIVGDPL